MEAGASFARVGTGPSDVVVIRPKDAVAVGYDRTADVPFEDIVARQPGETWGARLRNATQLVLGEYENDKDAAMRELRDGGAKGIIRFADDGTPIGGKALAGALRASAKHPRMHRMLTRAEMQNAQDDAAARFAKGEMPRSKRRVLTADERASRAAQQAKRDTARATLERTGGGTDLRHRPTAGKTRRAGIQAAGKARRESFARAKREATAARQAAERAARKAAPA
jgi:hypothetical protein